MRPGIGSGGKIMTAKVAKRGAFGRFFAFGTRPGVLFEKTLSKTFVETPLALPQGFIQGVRTVPG
jgi:hypothetical protein